MHQYKILKLLFLSLLIYYLYKNTTHDICHHIFMYDGRDKNTNSQTNSSTKHILYTYGGAQNETIVTKDEFFLHSRVATPIISIPPCVCTHTH